MTEEEILALEAGDQLNAEVASQIMGIKVEYPFGEGYPYYLRGDKDGKMKYDTVPQYSTDILAAWPIVMGCPGMKITFHRTIRPSVIEGSDSLKKLPDGRLEWFYVVHEGHEVRAPEAPEAVCKAALLSKLEAKDA